MDDTPELIFDKIKKAKTDSIPQVKKLENLENKKFIYR